MKTETFCKRVREPWMWSWTLSKPKRLNVYQAGVLDYMNALYHTVFHCVSLCFHVYFYGYNITYILLLHFGVQGWYCVLVCVCLTISWSIKSNKKQGNHLRTCSRVKDRHASFFFFQFRSISRKSKQLITLTQQSNPIWLESSPSYCLIKLN